MRLLFVTLLLVVIGSVSCEKYKLKQPAYLGFGWEFFDQQSGVNQPTVTGGYFYLNQFQVYGTREKGPDVDLVQSLPVQKTSFASGGNLGLTMDVPVGDYNQFGVRLTVTDEQQPCLVLRGEYNRNGAIIPFRIEWGSDKLLSFVTTKAFSLKKKKDYNVTIGVDVQQLFSGLTADDWEKATMTLEPGGSMIIIHATNNPKLFLGVNDKLASALEITVGE